EQRVAKATANKANILTVIGRYRQALALHEAARQVFEQAGDRLAALREQHAIAQVHLGSGDYSRALRLLIDALAEAEALDLDNEAGWTGTALAECHARLNDDLEARARADEAAARFELCGSPTEAAKARLLSAQARGRLGAPEEALAVLEDVARTFEQAE